MLCDCDALDDDDAVSDAVRVSVLVRDPDCDPDAVDDCDDVPENDALPVSDFVCDTEGVTVEDLDDEADGVNVWVPDAAWLRVLLPEYDWVCDPVCD